MGHGNGDRVVRCDVKIGRRWGECMSGCLDMYFVPWVGGCHVGVTRVTRVVELEPTRGWEGGWEP